MPEYRLYLLGPEDRIRSGFDFVAEDDIAAYAEAKRRHHNHAVEVWSGARKVLRLDAKSNASASEARQFADSIPSKD